jgi:glycosyltransferase involved in cell wall biosynthesis
MTEPLISTTIITFNEEKNIKRCLESVKWTDEIIVVDSGSTDSTVEICKEYGCRVFNRAWEGYASQKNFAIDQAKGDWILSLDADEEVTPELADEIKKAVCTGNADAYYMPRLNLFLGKWMRHGGWYPDRQLRLFKRGSGRFKIVPLHECVVIDNKEARVGHLSNPLRHYTYPTIRDYIERMDRYTSIEVASVIEQGQVTKNHLFSLLSAFPLKFVETYIYKGGWLDGIHGFIAAVMGAVRVFIRQVKLWEASNLTNGSQFTR